VAFSTTIFCFLKLVDLKHHWSKQTFCPKSKLFKKSDSMNGDVYSQLDHVHWILVMTHSPKLIIFIESWKLVNLSLDYCNIINFVENVWQSDRMMCCLSFKFRFNICFAMNSIIELETLVLRLFINHTVVRFDGHFCVAVFICFLVQNLCAIMTIHTKMLESCPSWTQLSLNYYVLVEIAWHALSLFLQFHGLFYCSISSEFR
jgi:hypothetical protein